MEQSINALQAILLGIVQGATEFIPVSSSGHLVIVPWMMGWPTPSLLFDTMLHWGTLVAIFIVFWRDFLVMIRAWFASIFGRSFADPNARLAWFILVGTLPAVVAGLLFADPLEAIFLNPRAVGFFMLVTAGLLFFSEQLMKRQQNARSLDRMNWTDAILIGVAQAFALFPGVSRSGSTIAAGLSRGIRRDLAARYSFMLGTPAFLGAGLLQIVKVAGEDSTAITGNLIILVLGFASAAIVGVLAIRFLLAYLRNRTLYIFSAYCFVVGLLTIALTFVRS